LPFVIAAIGQFGDKMTPSNRKVHDAQMAAGKNIPHGASINTLPYNFPKEQCPPGYERNFRNNAKSFLLIGGSMGEAMVELQSK